MLRLATPAVVPQAASSWVVVWSENVEAFDPAPLSDPANEPATVTVPPVEGRLKPTCPALSGTMA